jgi:hypothetical protein
MHQSGKIVAYCSAALSVAAITSFVTLSVVSPWMGASRSAARPGEPEAVSEQAKTPPGGAATPSEQVLALAAAVSGPDPQPAASDPAQAGSPPLSPAAPQAGETEAPPPQWSTAEVAAALMECVNLLAPVAADVIPLAPIRYNDCGTPAPVLLRSIGSKDKVAVDPPMLMNCPMVVALSRWMEKTVQPAARATLGSPVARIAGSGYACRNLYNLPNERRSQHAYANAIDLPVFFLADGRKVDLTQGWGPTRRDLVAGVKLVPIVSKTPEGAAGGVTTADMKANGGTAEATVVKASAEQPADGAAPTPKAAPLPDPLAAPEAKFLRRVHRGACDVFSTVLGPEANDVHRTHLHLDLQDRHAQNVCQ